MTVYVTAAGVLKAVNRRRTSTPLRETRDALVAVLRATTDDEVLLIDAEGVGYRVPLADVPVVPTRQRGMPLAQLSGSPPAAPIVGAVVLADDVDVLTLSARGQIKRTGVDEYRGRTMQMIAAGVRDDDALIAVAACSSGDEVIVAHTGGQVIRFAVDDVRPTGRPSTGVAAQQVGDLERCIAPTIVPDGAIGVEVATLDRSGAAKRSPLDDYPVQKRGGKGVLSGARDLAFCGVATDLHVVTTDGPEVVRPVQLPVAGRGAAPAPALNALVGAVVGEQPGSDGVR